MSLLVKAQALQHKRMEALRKYVADMEDLDRKRHELDLATSRAWVKVVHAGWSPADLTGLGLTAPKRTRTKPTPVSNDEAAAETPVSEPMPDKGHSDG